MNQNDLANLTVSYLDDLAFGYFTRPQVNTWLNNAQRKVQRILIDLKQNFYLKCVESQTVANQCNLTLPQDFMIAHRVVLVISGTYPNENIAIVCPITLMQQDLMGPTPAMPEAYYFKRNNLCFAPIPDQTYAIRLTYSYEVADMTNGNSVPDVPERYHELLAIYAALDGFVKDDRDNTYLMSLADKYIADMKAESQQRQEQQSRTVRTHGDFDDYGGSMF